MKLCRIVFWNNVKVFLSGHSITVYDLRAEFTATVCYETDSEFSVMHSVAGFPVMVN